MKILNKQWGTAMKNIVKYKEGQNRTEEKGRNMKETTRKDRKIAVYCDVQTHRKEETRKQAFD